MDRKKFLKYILLGSTGTAIAAAGVKFATTPKVAHDAASYVIYQSDSSFHAKNGVTGEIDYSGKDAAVIIQEAINALNNGGIVFIKAGRYPLTSVLNVKSNVQVIGEGCSTALLVGSDVYGAMKVVDDPKAEKIRISNLKIDGNKTNQTDTMTETGLITLDATRKIEEIYIDHIWFKDAFFCDIVSVGYDYNPSKISITNIKSIDCGDNGSRNAPHSLYLTNLENSYIGDYYVYNCHHNSFDIRTAGVTDAGIYRPKKTVRVRSVFVGLISENAGGFGFSLYTTDVIFLGCCSVNSNQLGVRLLGCERTILSGCVVKNSGKDTGGDYDGILITDSSNDNIVMGCHCYDDQKAKTQRYGIHLAGDRNQIINNNLEGNKVKGLYRSGDTHSIIRDNIGYITENGGAAFNVADGGAIEHGLATTPTHVEVTPSIPGEIVAVTSMNSNDFTIAIKKYDGSTGTQQKIYWKASI